jgi:hypothetical protein
VHACHPRGALPAPGLAGYPVENSRGTRKLARTPHMNQKNKIK